MAEGWRKPVLALSRSLGIEPALRRAQYTFAGPRQRRDFRDTAHMRLLMRLSLPIDANCLDIGANVGDVLREMVAIAPRGRHIAYEPLPELASELARRFPDVDVRNAAVAEEGGSRTFYRVKSAHSRSSLAATGLDPDDLEATAVRVEVLDSDLPTDYVPTLIKIDVEGAESAVFAGARDLLAKHHPIVIFEHGGAAHASGQDPTREIHELLTGLDYRIFDIDGGGPLGIDELTTAVRKGRIWTFVAHR